MKQEKRSVLLNIIFKILTLFKTSNWRSSRFIKRD